MHDNKPSHDPLLTSQDVAADRVQASAWSDQPADQAASERMVREQLFDARVSQVLHDVALPAGLADRILSRLADECRPVADPGLTIESARGPDADSVLSLERSAAAAEEVAPAGRHRLRRRGAVAWLTAAAALLLIAWSGYQFGKSPVWTLPQVLERAVAFHELSARDTQGEVPIGLEFSEAIRRPSGVVGRRVVGLLGREGAAYDIRRGKVRATLYVVRARAGDLPASPPAQPDSMTGGRSVAAWQENGLLYVLVVEGGPREYHLVSQRVVT